MISALRLTLRATDTGSRVTFLFAKRKVTKRNAPPAASRRAAHVGALRSSVRRGTARNSLRSDTRASSPSPDLRCSARLKADSTSNATAAPSRSTPRVEALVLPYPVIPSRLARARCVQGRAGGACGVSAPWARGMPRAGWAGRPTPVLPFAQDSANEQARPSLHGRTSGVPAIPTRPTHPIIRFMRPTATPLQTPGHPACRPC